MSLHWCPACEVEWDCDLDREECRDRTVTERFCGGCEYELQGTQYGKAFLSVQTFHQRPPKNFNVHLVETDSLLKKKAANP